MLSRQTARSASRKSVLVDNDIPENVDVARRLGLMDGLVQVETRYSMKASLSREQGLSEMTI